MSNGPVWARDALAKAVGRRLQQGRKLRGLTQEDVAGRTGLYREIVGRLERGRHVPSIDSIARIAGALDLPLSFFVEPADQLQCYFDPSFGK